VDVSELLAGIRTELDGGKEIRIDVPAGVRVRADSTVLDRVFRSLMENALEHAGTDPDVEVTCTNVASDHVTFEVRDDGPGIPDDEREVLHAGEETALRHGSGLGLWVAKWGVTSMDGELRFETDDAGTTAVVTLPRGDGPDTPESGSTS
jgi:signal transduction histidine kinase